VLDLCIEYGLILFPKLVVFSLYEIDLVLIFLSLLLVLDRIFDSLRLALIDFIFNSLHLIQHPLDFLLLSCLHLWLLLFRRW